MKLIDASSRTASRPRPSAVVGVVGGGQLARMLHQAAIGLDVELRVLARGPDAPAVAAGARLVPGDPGEPSDLRRLAEGCDVVTFDHELVPGEQVRRLVSSGAVVQPQPDALLLAQDKVEARRMLGAAGFPVPEHAVVRAGDLEGVRRFAERCGWPMVLKAPRGGYDGRGVELVEDERGLLSSPLAGSLDAWLLEEHVAIAHEVAVLLARRPGGHWSAYPLVQTTQVDGVCHELVLPASLPPSLAEDAVALAASIADGIGATGLIAVELFVTVQGRLLVNELALRPHNSGHATIDAAVTSQFENHLRGVLDWPLGSTELVVPAAATVNLLGGTTPVAVDERLPAALADPRVRVHLYRKAHRDGRKLGHVTALGETVDDALDAARAAAAVLLAP